MLATTSLSNLRARPVLKWAGGKTRLLPDLIQRLPPAFRAYHEPFVGSAALFFELHHRQMPAGAHLSDINPSLMDVYTAVRDQVEEVINTLKHHPYDKDYYYDVRALDPRKLTLAQRAARFIYLNKTCYNGLYRENRSGQFNVPFGAHKNPTICDEPNLRAAAAALRGVQLACAPFDHVLKHAQADDLVYFDPPYYPVSATANFTTYTSSGFLREDHIRLREVVRALTWRGVYVILSNSDTPFTRQLYESFSINDVYAARAINSKASARGKVSEIVVCNFDEHGALSGV
jgi:DNA adenine methylase